MEILILRIFLFVDDARKQGPTRKTTSK